MCGPTFQERVDFLANVAGVDRLRKMVRFDGQKADVIRGVKSLAHAPLGRAALGKLILIADYSKVRLRGLMPRVSRVPDNLSEATKNSVQWKPLFPLMFGTSS
jgi:hypothetical protein